MSRQFATNVTTIYDIFCPVPFPDLPFLAFSVKGKENDGKSKDFLHRRTPKILGKEGENIQKSKEFLVREKSKEFQKRKERKIRVPPVPFWISPATGVTSLGLRAQRSPKQRRKQVLTADRKRGRRKGATSKNVKKCQKYFRHFSTIFFAQGKKEVKNRQKVSKYFSTLFDNFRAAPVFRPLLGASEF